MALGIIIGWLNTLLLFSFGIIAILTGRSKRIRMTVFYALLYSLLGSIYKIVLSLLYLVLGYYPPEIFVFYSSIRSVMYLLIMLAVVEILRKDFNLTFRNYWWAAPALVLTILFGVIFPNLDLISYYSPRVLIWLAIAFTIKIAIERKNLFLLNYGFLSVGLLFIDFLMLIQRINYPVKIELIERTQQILDPVIYLLSNALFLTALFAPELSKVIPWFAKFVDIRPGRVLKMRTDGLQTDIEFVDSARPENANHVLERIRNLSKQSENISKANRLITILNCIFNGGFGNYSELATYLNSTKMEAQLFVKAHNLKTQLVNNKIMYPLQDVKKAANMK